MNEIRKNTEKEQEIVRATFKMPLITMIVYGAILLIFLIFFIAGLSTIGKTEYIPYLGEFDKTDYFMITLGLFGIIFTVLCFGLQFFGLKKSSCIVTDRVIKGVATIFFVKKSYSYRLDEIDNVELNSSLGEHYIKLNFSQGNGRPAPVNYGSGVWGSTGNFFNIKYVENYQEVYDKLTETLLSVKNEKDLMVDLEMAKIQVQKEQVQAISNLANVNHNENSQSDYLSQLEKLSELQKKGVITQEEFDKKRKELLGL